MRFVLDTTVLVAAIRSNQGASHQLLRAALKEEFTLLLSVPLFLEYEAVMTRPEHLKVLGLSAAEVNTLLDTIASVGEPISLDFLWRPILPDANDDMVLETAANGRADVVVTFNLRDFEKIIDQFEFAVSSPGKALKTLRRKGKP